MFKITFAMNVGYACGVGERNVKYSVLLQMQCKSWFTFTIPNVPVRNSTVFWLCSTESVAHNQNQIFGLKINLVKASLLRCFQYNWIYETSLSFFLINLLREDTFQMKNKRININQLCIVKQHLSSSQCCCDRCFLRGIFDLCHLVRSLLLVLLSVYINWVRLSFSV